MVRGGNSISRDLSCDITCESETSKVPRYIKRKPCSVPDRSVSGRRVSMGQYISTMFYGNGAADDKHQWQDDRDVDRWDEENGEMQLFNCFSGVVLIT